jgi:hypothetical protein
MKYLLRKKRFPMNCLEEISTSTPSCEKLLKTAAFLNNYFTLGLKP